MGVFYDNIDVDPRGSQGPDEKADLSSVPGFLRTQKTMVADDNKHVTPVPKGADKFIQKLKDKILRKRADKAEAAEAEAAATAEVEEVAAGSGAEEEEEVKEPKPVLGRQATGYPRGETKEVSEEEEGEAAAEEGAKTETAEAEEVEQPEQTEVTEVTEVAEATETTEQPAVEGEGAAAEEKTGEE